MARPERRPSLVKAPTGEHPLAPSPRAVPAEPAEPVTVMLSARVPAELRDRVKLHALQHRSSVQDVVLAAVTDYLTRFEM